MYQQTDGLALPDCKTERGCAVGSELLSEDPLIQVGQSLAADPYITDFVNAFVRAKALYDSNGIAEAQRETFEELGLMDEPDFLLQLENIYAEAKRVRAKKENDRHKRSR